MGFPVARLVSVDAHCAGVDCYKCGSRVALHQYRDGRFHRTMLDRRYAVRPARVDGMAAYGPREREARRPISFAFANQGAGRNAKRTAELARERPEFRYLAESGPTQWARPPFHVWCVECGAPQTVERAPARVDEVHR